MIIHRPTGPRPHWRLNDCVLTTDARMYTLDQGSEWPMSEGLDGSHFHLIYLLLLWGWEKDYPECFRGCRECPGTAQEELCVNIARPLMAAGCVTLSRDTACYCVLTTETPCPVSEGFWLGKWYVRCLSSFDADFDEVLENVQEKGC